MRNVINFKILNKERKAKMKKVTVTPLNAVVLNGKATELTEKQVIVRTETA